MAYFVWRKLTRLIMPRATGASMPLPALPLRAVGYTVSIYLLVATIMIPLILARVNRSIGQSDIVKAGQEPLQSHSTLNVRCIAPATSA